MRSDRASAGKQFARFALIGSIGALLYVGTVALLVDGMSTSSVMANMAAFSINTVFSFLMNTWLNFSVPFTLQKWVKFLMVSLLGLALTGAIAAVADSCGLHYGYGILMVVVTVPPLTFYLHRNWTYAEMDDIVTLQKTLYTSRNPVRRWLHTSRRDAVLDAVCAAPVPRHERALEVGPGSGVYLPTLCNRFASVTAIDVEPAHISALAELKRSHGNLDLCVTDLCNHEWTAKFDLVLCSEVIEHVPNPGAFMAGLARAVDDGGILVLSTPQPWSLMEVAAAVALSPAVIWLPKLIYREPVLPTGHISVQSRRRIRELLEANGLTTIRSDYLGLYMPVLAEFGGQSAVRILDTLERTIKRVGPIGLLWTQLHVARKQRLTHAT